MDGYGSRLSVIEAIEVFLRDHDVNDLMTYHTWDPDTPLGILARCTFLKQPLDWLMSKGAKVTQRCLLSCFYKWLPVLLEYNQEYPLPVSLCERFDADMPEETIHILIDYGLRINVKLGPYTRYVHPRDGLALRYESRVLQRVDACRRAFAILIAACKRSQYRELLPWYKCMAKAAWNMRGPVGAGPRSKAWQSTF